MSPFPCRVIFQISQPGFGRSEDPWCSAEERQRWYSQYHPHEGILLLSESLLHLFWTAGVKYIFLYTHLGENCSSCALQDLIFMSSSEELAARKEHSLNTDCITEPLITQGELKKATFRLHTGNDMIQPLFSVLSIEVFFPERPVWKRVNSGLVNFRVYKYE